MNEPIEYRISIRNDSYRSYRNLVVSVRIPGGMQFNRRAVGPPGTRSTLAENSILQFSPLIEMRPNDELTYRIEVLALGAGVATVVAQVDADGLSRRIVVREETHVY